MPQSAKAPVPTHTGRAVPYLLMAADVLTIASVVACAVALKRMQDSELDCWLHLQLAILLPLFVAVFEVAGLYHGSALYPGAAFGPAEELRRMTYATTAIFATFGAFHFFAHQHGLHRFSRFVLLGSWMACVLLLPMMRVGARKLLTRLGIWGVPAIVVGEVERATQILQRLRQHPEYGLFPVGIVGLDREPPPCYRVGSLEQLDVAVATYRVRYGIIIDGGSQASEERLDTLVREYGTHFSHLLIIPRHIASSTVWVSPRDLNGILGLEIRQNLLIPAIARSKLLLDYAATLVLSFLAVPLALGVAVLIRLDSRGPVLYRQKRIGRGGREFTILKFRTMHVDADRKLAELLAREPAMRAEWEQYQKLRHDPRVTRVGGWLRRTSLDEIPQLWNVLRGEMALVGPRPIVAAEIERYGAQAFAEYGKVKPGLSGLWQVSGRSDTSYEQRVLLDLYYINNWSPWMDIYILLKTFYAVLAQRGSA